MNFYLCCFFAILLYAFIWMSVVYNFKMRPVEFIFGFLEELWRAAKMAAIRPAAPAPMTAISAESFSLTSSFFNVLGEAANQKVLVV